MESSGLLLLFLPSTDKKLVYKQITQKSILYNGFFTNRLYLVTLAFIVYCAKLKARRSG